MENNKFLNIRPKSHTCEINNKKKQQTDTK